MKTNHCMTVTCLILFSALLGCGKGTSAPATNGGSAAGCDPTAGACATRIESSGQLIGGGLAQGQVGDFLLENDRMRFIVQRPVQHIAVSSQFGGNVIDCDVNRPAGNPGEDVFGELGFLVNLAGTVRTESVEVEEPGGPGRQAVVVTRGGYDLSGYFILGMAAKTLVGFDPFSLRGVDLDQPWPLRFEIRYILSPGSPGLRVEFTARNTGSDPVPFLLAYFVQGGQVNLFLPGRSAFGSGEIDVADMIFFDPVERGIPVGYGLTPDGREDRFLLAMLGAQVLLHKGEVADIILFPDRSPDSVPPGGSLTFGSYFVAGKDVDQAIENANKVADQKACSPVLGRVVEDGSGLPIHGADVTALREPGTAPWPLAITHTRTGSQGRFQLCLPPGPAALIAGQTGRPYADGRSEPTPVPLEVPFRAEPPETPDVTLTLPPTARLHVEVKDSFGDRLPARLTLLGLDPSPPDSGLQGDGFDPLAPGVLRMVDSITGEFDIFVEPGDMDLVITRGVEYSMFRQPLALSANEAREIQVQLHHVVNTRGFLSGDFHVHSAPGPDCVLSYRKRVANMLTEGVDVIVATDHAYVSDYWPTIREMGVAGKIATIAGQEITTFSTGHFGPFPLPRTDTPNGGAINWVGKSPVQLVEEVLGINPNAVFQIMHPRAIPAPGNISNYFTLIDLLFDMNGPFNGPDAFPPGDSRLPPDTQWLSPRFNAMEVITFGNVQGLSDWFNLLNAGWRLTATGNSDTHTRWVEGSGYARNLVRVGEGYDDLADFDAEHFTRAVREGKNSVTLGAFIDMTIRNSQGPGQARVGELLDAPAGTEIKIDVQVQSPSWLVADRLTLYENGVPFSDIPALPSPVPGHAGGTRNEFRTTVARTVSGDAHYTASVTGSQSLYPLLPYNWKNRKAITLEQIRSGSLPGTILPFSVTNPVWVDADGDGSISPNHRIVPQDCQEYRKDDRTNPYVPVPARNCKCVLENKAPGCGIRGGAN